MGECKRDLLSCWLWLGFIVRFQILSAWIASFERSMSLRGRLSGGAANFTTAKLSSGTHNIAATYNGNTSFIGSTSPATSSRWTAGGRSSEAGGGARSDTSPGR